MIISTDRLLARTVIVAILIISVIGCDRTDDSKDKLSVKTSIIFLHYFTDSLSGGINDMAAVFNSRNQQYDLKPTAINHESFETSIRYTLKSSPPDLYSYWAGARTQSILEDLTPIDRVWQQYQLDQCFSPVIIKAACEYDGHKYFVPLTQHYIGFFYNKKIFDTHNITPPTTWDEFLVVCEQLKNQQIIPIALGIREKWPAQFWFDLLLMRTAPYSFRSQLMQGQVGYDNPVVTAVFETWAQLIERGYFNAEPNDLSWDTGANELVYTGKAAMTLVGSWVIGQWTDAQHQWVAGRDFDFFSFPIIDPIIPLVSTGPIDGLVVPGRAVNKNGAEEVMVFLTEAAPQLAMSRGAGALAPSLKVSAQEYDTVRQRMMQEIMHSAHFAFPYDLSTPPPIADLGINAMTEFLEFPAERQQIQQRLADDVAHWFTINPLHQSQ
ncbi:extracellular solute-binding protein [Rhodopseudomonas palustris]|uniref:Extracellular solute-binding protein n=1 Tax=Thiospirillum jenense TaxID=1653858 RepID=A0A839HCK1_9GAMM|nr:extracellular solute-binding protein [Thiospirillum jenense]MBB1089669.1 extracellular solute-binding protein [Rhodopseudomonas palustris]MBB1124769.1 extracellular solute-binding protein [Thiospirillum jenense]